MASVLKVDKLDPQSGTALEIGTSGDTLNVPSGVTLDINSGATLDATGATVTGAIGKILQVVNTIYTSETASSSSTYADTGLTLNITPSATTSKVLIQVCQAGVGKNSANTKCQIKLLADGVAIHQFEDDAGYNGATTSNYVGSSSTTYLHSPSTTSAVTYKTQFASSADAANVSVNTNASDSSITLMEVGA